MRQFTLADLTWPEDAKNIYGKIMKYARFSQNVASTATIVAGVTGKRLVIHGLVAGCLSAGNFTLWSGATPIFPTWSYAANAQIMVDYSPVGWAQVSHGVGINAYTVAANTVTGVIIYSEDD